MVYGFRFINWHIKYLNKASRTTQYKMGAALYRCNIKNIKALKNIALSLTSSRYEFW